jgi:quercetin dioxygenase-like cupin family protein
MRKNRMIVSVALLLTLLLAGAPDALAQDAGAAAKVTTSKLFSSTTTASGQPIALPKGNAEVVVWMYEIPAGAKLPVHKHPSPRYAYVLQGTLRVVTADESRTWDYKTGDFIVEMIDAWHYGMNTGSEPVRLLVIDQVEAGRGNVLLR